MRFSSRLCAVLLGVTLPTATLALAAPAGAVSPDVVISQVYGGGGNSGATLRNDFIELFNRGTSAVDVTGFSVQYASATGTTFQVTPLSGTIPPGSYYLVQEGQGAGGTQALPAPDAAGTIAMSGTAGKVALVTNSAALLCGASCEPGPDIRDFVGYGTTASEFEGSAPAPVLSNTAADSRAGAGCIDTDSNGADFTAGPPAPRNGASPTNPCSGPAVSTLSVNDVITAEPTNGPTTATFTVTLSSATTVTVDYSTADGTATAPGDFTAAAGTLTFDPGETTETVSIPVTDDAVDEADETFTLLLSNATGGAVIADGTGTATIIDNDDPPPVPGAVRIHDIQGAQHRSPLLGTIVDNVEGVVTAARSNGLFIEDDAPDADLSTAEGLFVFTGTGSNPPFTSGQRVLVDGTVSEFRPGGETGTGLSITQITSSLAGIAAFGTGTVTSTIIGAAGRTPPTDVIEDDSNGSVEVANSFDPATDGIDFYESLEGMLVTVDDPVVVDAASESVSFGEYVVLADNGAFATGRTLRGGIEVDADDFNPERIFLDDALFATPVPAADVGDTLSDATGVFDYGFGNYKVLLLGPPTVTSGGLTPESTRLAGQDELTVATFNVENLDPSDGAAKFAALAALVCDNLAAPDLISLEEVQDNNGPTNDAVVDADVTASTLIAAIAADCAVDYAYADIDPVDDQDGGEPGGNIRVGFLYRGDRGLDFVERPGAASTTPNAVQAGPGGAQLAFSPGRVDPTNPAFASSRKPLAGEFTYNGETMFVIGNHFNSKGGDEPLFGRNQPPTRSSEVQRRQQAAVVNDFVEAILAVDAAANVIVLGDLNDFEFSDVLGIVAGDDLTNLTAGVPDADRYTFIFEGNSQALDHILVSNNLEGTAEVDIVHSNIEFADGVSDHDPQVAFLGITRPTASISDSTVVEGTGGTTEATFTITLDRPSSTEQRVGYATADGSAVAPQDYASESGTAVFAPGQTSATISVTAVSDNIDELTEQFLVSLSPTSSTTAVGDGQGSATITDDDAAPRVRVSDAGTREFDSGTRPLDFTVTLNRPSSRTVTVRFTTANGSAAAGSDYQSRTGTVTFLPGQTSRTVSIQVVGDRRREPNETFVLNIFNPVNAVLGDEVGVGVIRDDD